MNDNPFAPDFEDLPEDLPIFPLKGVLLLPHGSLPLNIFEPRYLRMVEDALKRDRLIGMIQPKAYDEGQDMGAAAIYEVGCAGKITEFCETPDGRYQITLRGICRFHVVREIEKERSYRRIKTDWGLYESDLEPQYGFALDRARFKEMLRHYFLQEGMECDWEAIDKAPDSKLITCLSMICPFEDCEKQALLEALSCAARAELLMTMVEMALKNRGAGNSRH